MGRQLGWRLILIWCCGGVARAGDWFVDLTNPACPGSGSSVDPFCTISDAIGAAANGDTIHIAPGTYLELLTITKDLTLTGTAGAAVTIVDGQGLGNVVSIQTSSQVTLDGLRIQGGLAAQGAGILVAASSALTLTHSTVQQNVSTQAGGGLYLGPSSTAVLQSSSVLDNHANSQGAGILSRFAYLSATDCDISGNQTDSQDGGTGGGIYMDRGTLVLTSSTVANNQTLGNTGYDASRGGGIFGTEGTLTIRGSTLQNNEVGNYSRYTSGYGGAIWVESGSLLLENSLVLDNSGGVGAGVGSASAPLTITCSTIRGNQAQLGGGVYAGPGAPLTMQDVVVTDNRAAQLNYADGRGAGIFCRATTTLTQCTVASNRGYTSEYSSFLGAGIAATGTTEIVRCVVESNTIGYAGDGQGFGAGVQGSDLTLRQCTVRGNGPADATLELNGGGIHSSGSLVLEDSLVHDNSATSGGGVMVTSLVATKTLRRSTIAGNSADSGGGVFGDVKLRTTILAGNFDLAGPASPDAFGNLTLNGYNVIGNTAGATLSGSSSLDLLDVDPLFVNPGAGDYRLQVGSPAIDTGPANFVTCDRDARRVPRLLDGDLDGVAVVDRGGLEYSHIEIDVQGIPQPGQLVTIAPVGTAGMFAFLVAGAPANGAAFGRIGCLFVDLSLPFVFVPLGVLPAAPLSGNIPLGIPSGTEIALQGMAFSGGGTGNMANDVVLRIE